MRLWEAGWLARFPDGAKGTEPAKEQEADRHCAAVGIEWEKLQGGRARGRSGEVAEPNRRFMETAMLALGFTYIHRIEKR